MTRPQPLETRVVMLGGAVPYPGVRHAGGLYVHHLTRSLSEHGVVEVIAPDHTANQKALEHVDTRVAAHLVGRWASPSSRQRLLQRGVGIVERGWRRVDPAAPPLGILVSLYFDPRVRESVASADLVDLQWFEFIRLAPHIRRLNPSARIVGTFHDVLSQLYARRADDGGLGRWRRAETVAIAAERRSLRHLDSVLTLNEKDAELLRRRGATEVEVIDPPLSPVALPNRDVDSASPEVVFVGYFARQVNVDAATWFIDQVWPEVIAAVPHARLTLVGLDPDGALAPLVSRAVQVTAAGFVDELSPVYARAAAVVVPLLSGSGVKFKTIQAMTHGVPTISTSVGAEGIAHSDELEAVTDNPAAFAGAVVGVLRDQRGADLRADDLAGRLSATYGEERFRETVKRIYGQDEPQAAIDRDSVTVVIPYYGEPTDTLNLIEQLRGQDGLAEIIVADDASPVPFPQQPGVRLVRREANGGFGAAVNTGSELVETDLMLVLNSDLEVGATFIRDLLYAAGPLPTAVVSPQVVKSNGEPEWTARQFPRIRHHVVEWLSPLARWRHLPALQRAVGHVTALTPGGSDRVDWVIGAAMLLPVRDFRSVGGFDERYFMTSEEVDLQRRLLARGVPSYVANTVTVTHVGGGSSDTSLRRQWLLTARQRYVNKWGGSVAFTTSLALASLVNFAVNAPRQLTGRDLDARATLRYELGLLRAARQQASQPSHPSTRIRAEHA
ncbi:glycosyltransferase [Pseudoclavibacter sp. AY1H1]|uniref:glycosyltransferase n=1 Tax=Pseudoclavibacter sp. AY1H1 TaxID=2080584 RepID=UPI0011AFEF04|nr:glycosyltransferase [Pseudoclavibacter sp. AY1H1]